MPRVHMLRQDAGHCKLERMRVYFLSVPQERLGSHVYR